MAKHGIRANRRKEAPRATIQASPTVYKATKPVGSAERFLDDAAREALASAAAAAMPAPGLGRFAPGAVRETAIRYPDPLLAEAARLPEKALAESAARADVYRRAMEAQNEVVRAASTALSPVGNMVINQAGATAHDALTRQDAEGGDATGSETAVSETPVSEASAPQGGPRIVINPTTFKNSKDALCVAFNEGFRVIMEATGFEPQSEPTDAQRKFFSDTAYADDEVQLRRTILARIATFDTSVKDPTDDQLSETASFLGSVLESDWCKNEWERDSVSRLMNAVQSAVGAEPVEPRQEPLEAREAEPLQRRAAMGGGETEDDENRPAAPLPQGDSGAEGAKAEEPRYFNESGHMWDDESDSPEKGATRFAYQDGGWVKQTYTGEGWNGEALGDEEGEAVRKKVVNAIYFSDPDEKSAPEPKQISAEEPEQAPQQKPSKLSEPQKPENQPAPDMSWDEIADAQEKLGAARKKQRESAEASALAEFAEEMRKPVGPEGAQRVEESGKRLLASAPPEDDGQTSRRLEEPGQTSRRLEEPGRLTADFDRSQFGQDGRIGIGERIVDPETGKSQSSLSMNGPAIKPARAIGDLGSRALTDTKSMNGPSIQLNRAIGDMGSTELADPTSMNGPSIQPVQQIGDIGSRALTDTKSMNGPALTPRRRIGDMGGRTLANNRRRR